MLSHALADRPVLLLSPHLDDAVFSAFALVERPDTSVWTVFAGVPAPGVATEWDERCGFPDAASLMAARLAEDASALAGVDFRRLPLLDRAYSDPGRRRADLARLGDEVSTWLDAHPTGVLAVPVGAGVTMATAWYEPLRTRLRPEPTTPAGEAAESTAPTSRNTGRRRTPLDVAKDAVRAALHADFQRRRSAAQRRGMLANEDHLVVRDHAFALAATRGVDVVLYEELPYLWSRSGDAAAQATATRHGRTVRLITETVDPARKFARLRSYVSQLRMMDPEGRRLEDPATLPAVERYWMSGAAGSLGRP